MTTTCSHRIGVKGSKSCADCGVRLRGSALTEARMSRAIGESREEKARLIAIREAEDDAKDRADASLGRSGYRVPGTSAIEARFSTPDLPRRRLMRPRRGMSAAMLLNLAMSLGTHSLVRK